jgi:predicted PP-loop superfamily ATPase
MNFNLFEIAKAAYQQHLRNDYGINYQGRYDIEFEKGSTYMKVVHLSSGGSRSSHSFIVLKPVKGFQVGDILKSASWKAPALNFKRGNIFQPETWKNIRWTGAM